MGKCIKKEEEMALMTETLQYLYVKISEKLH